MERSTSKRSKTRSLLVDLKLGLVSTLLGFLI